MQTRYKYWVTNGAIIVIFVLFWEFLLSNPGNVEWVNQSHQPRDRD